MARPKLVDLVLELLVDRRQLLVGRLQLLVHRHHFLVGAFQLLVRRFEFFDRGPELDARLVEFVFEIADAVFLGVIADLHIAVVVGFAAKRRRVLEDEQRLEIVERIGDDVDREKIVVRGVDAHVALDGAFARAPGRLEHAANGGTKSAPRQIGHLRRRRTFGKLQIFAGAARRTDHVVVGTHDDMRRSVAFQDFPRRRVGPFHSTGGAGLAVAHEPLKRFDEERHRDGLAVHAAPAINARAVFERFEEITASADVFRRSEKQPSARPQRIVEDRDEPLLQIGIQIDEQIAAHDHVDARERRILDQIVIGDAHHVADRLGEHEFVVLREEIAVEQFEGYVLDGALRIAGAPRLLQHGLVDVGGEDLHVRSRPRTRQLLRDQDRDAVGFLAAGAARCPDADLVARALGGKQRGNDLAPQEIERLRIAKEAGDVDEEVAEKKLRLVRLAAQLREIFLACHGSDHLHAALDAAKHGRALVLAEIVAESHAQFAANLEQEIGDVGKIEDARRPAFEVIANGRRHRRHVEHLVDQSRRHRAVGHAVVFRGLRPLHNRQAARLLDRTQTFAAVAAGAGKYDASRIRSLVERQTAEEVVDRAAKAARLGKFGQSELVAVDREARIGRNQINAIGFDRHAVGDLLHGHGRAPSEQFGEHAFVVGIEMLHENIGEPRIRRRGRQEVLKSFEAACGRAKSHHRTGRRGHSDKRPVGREDRARILQL